MLATNWPTSCYCCCSQLLLLLGRDGVCWFLRSQQGLVLALQRLQAFSRCHKLLTECCYLLCLLLCLIFMLLQLLLQMCHLLLLSSTCTAGFCQLLL
jgi:hypothetical protein